MENFVYILITGLIVFLVMYSQLKKKDTDLKVLQAQEENKIDIKPSMIQPVEEIKSLGKFKVKVSLHSEVDAEITVNVTSADTIQ